MKHTISNFSLNLVLFYIIKCHKCQPCLKYLHDTDNCGTNILLASVKYEAYCRMQGNTCCWMKANYHAP